MTLAKRRFLVLCLLGELVACAGDGIDTDPRGDGSEEDRADDAQDRGSEPAAATAGPTPVRPRWVTLVTGDRVLVHEGGAGTRYSLVPAPGRDRMRFRTHTARGHHHVVPEDAAALIAAGRLDPSLFDVTLLVELAYDDARRPDIPLIVIRDGVRQGAVDALLAAPHARIDRALPSVKGVAVRASKPHAAQLWASLSGSTAVRRGSGAALADGITRIWLDGKLEPLLDVSVPQIGGPAAWEAGYTGAGVTVAVLDSGIALDHPDFEGRIAEAISFVEEEPDAEDLVGHGTHVASIVAGNGAASGGRFRGVAPDAQLFIGKVCGVDRCPFSAILAGMEWAAQSGAAAVNISLGGPDSAEVDVLEEAINTLSAQYGTLFVVAAGNVCNGPGVSSPGSADAALTVGSVNAADQLSFFSCRGPRIGDGAVKPDLTAPGEAIAAARAAGTPDGDVDPVDDFYARLTGTSMATPHVAGAAAILAQQHPDWTGEQLKAALMASARPTPDLSAFKQGAGRVDVARAITQTVSTSPASFNLGRAVWPHEDDEPVTATVTYRNRGAEPVTLALAFEVTDPAGEPAPAGMFSVAPETATIPAGGDAQVVVTADTRVAGPEGRYSGVLVGAAGDARVRTPLALDREPESYDLELAFVPRDDPPEQVGMGGTVFDLDTGDVFSADPVGDAITIRLPRARYAVHASLFESASATMIARPLLELTEDTTLVLDAGTAQPIAISVPDPTADRNTEEVAGVLPFGGSGIASFADAEGSMHALHMGPALPPEQYTALVASSWAEIGPPDNWQLFADSPYSYNLGYVAARGQFITGFTRDVAAEELAQVRQHHAAQGTGFTGEFTPVATSPDGDVLFGAFLPFRLPATRTDFFNTEDMTWEGLFNELDPDGAVTGFLSSRSVAYQPGQRYHERWNQAVLGPSFPDQRWVERVGDDIMFFFLSLHGDRAGHYGRSQSQTGHARLFRDGSLVGESSEPDVGFFTVPPEPADYRIELQTIRGGQSQLSTQIDVAWTFRSEHVEEPAALPVMAVRFAPALDQLNRAPSGQPFLIPISIARQIDAPAPALRRLTVEASYDGGTVWKRAIVLRFGDQAIALLHHPDGEGRVSLRAVAVDRDDNTVEQTIRDAYHLRAR